MEHAQLPVISPRRVAWDSGLTARYRLDPALWDISHLPDRGRFGSGPVQAATRVNPHQQCSVRDS
jgi:hypothetical protein